MDGDPAIVSWAIDENSARSLNNWTLKLDLTYISDTHIAFIGTAYFIGWAATLLWMPRFGDVWGRKRMYIVGKLTDLFVFITIFFTTDINVMIAAFFFFGAFTSLRVNVGYNYLVEMVPRSHKILMGTTWNINEGIPYLIMTIFFWTTHYGSWIWMVGIGFCMEIWCLCTVFFMPESPSWLIEKEMIDEAEQAMAMIARYNKMPFEWDRKLYTKKIENNIDSILEVFNLPAGTDQKSFEAYVEETLGVDGFINLMACLVVDEQAAVLIFKTDTELA
jgi:MFS family permease